MQWMPTVVQTLFRFLRPEPRTRRPRERFILPHEWMTIRPQLAKCPTKVRVYFTILFLTGCRRDELRTAQWSQFELTDPANAFWHKPKGKNGKRQVLPIDREVVALLNELPRVGPHVFTGKTEAHVWSRTAVKHWWRKIRWASGVPDVRIHDLRRSTASWMTMHGENLKTVQSVLDHSSLKTTEVYARLDVGATRAALRRHADRVMSVRQLQKSD